MREIKFEMQQAIKRVELLKDRVIRFKINKGRNKFVSFTGCICEIYPSVFVIHNKDDDENYTQSYTDVITKNVLFYPLIEKPNEIKDINSEKKINIQNNTNTENTLIANSDNKNTVISSIDNTIKKKVNAILVEDNKNTTAINECEITENLRKH